MIKLWTIAANAFTETIRQPIFLILILVTFGVLVVDVPLAGYGMDVDLQGGTDQLLIDLGLSSLMMSGLFVAAFAASGVLAREIERKTILTVVTKPVSRPIVLAGKCFGVAAAVTLAYYLASLAFLMTVRHGTMPTVRNTYDFVVIGFGMGAFVLAVLVAAFCNYFFGWHFSSTLVMGSALLMSVAMLVIAFVDKHGQLVAFGKGIHPQVLVVMLLLWMAVMVMTALAVAVSSRLGQMATLGVCLGVFLVSLVSDYLFHRFADQNFMAQLAYWIVPNLSFFFVLDALKLGRTITGDYVLLAAGYAALYSVGLLLLGVAFFQTREMDAVERSTSAPSMVHTFAWTLRMAALIVGIVGLTVLAGAPGRENLVWAGAMVVGAVGGWLLAGYLGRGVRWAHWLILFLTTVQLIGSYILVLSGRWFDLQPDQKLLWLTASTAVALYVLAMALRPATRNYFARRRRSVAL